MSVLPAWAEDWLYTVKPGDTVWDLSHDMLKDWRYWKEILRHNKIKDATSIRPGMQIAIPLYVVKQEHAEARVEAVHGDVQVTLHGSGKTIPLKPGVALSVGDRVATGSNSTAVLSLEDGSIILMQEQSELEFTRLRKLGGGKNLDAGLYVRKGGLKMDANPAHHPDNSYLIQTAAANSAVRGTGFRIGVEGETSRTEVLQGLVNVGNSLGSVDVPESFGTVVEKDAPPVKPVQLLDPPDLAVVPAVVRYLPAVVRLDTPAGAAGYHVQVARDDQFMELVLDRKVKEVFMIDQALADGSYHVRIRAMDTHGLEGKDAVTSFRVDARPEAPMVRQPLPGKVLHAGELVFSWADVEGVDSYLFELAADENFRDVRLHKVVDGTELKLPVSEGSWYFRLTSVSPEGKKGPPGRAVKIDVLPIPPVPQPKPPATEDGSLVLAWQDVEGVASYNVQVATDPDFQELVADETVREASLKLPRPPSGFYYFRLRSVDAEGYQGSFGAPQRFEVKPESYWPLALFGIAAALLLL
ncbi:FecR domain-containing protein [Thiolapillus sp.]